MSGATGMSAAAAANTGGSMGGGAITNRAGELISVEVAESLRKELDIQRYADTHTHTHTHRRTLCGV